MLKKLSNLCIEADGRYATAEELKFLKVYLDTVDQRISVYEKIRDMEEQIIYHTEAQKHKYHEHLFMLAGKDVTEICRRDMKSVLRCGAAAMLVDDLERYRDAFLIWFQTIVNAFGFRKDTSTTFALMQDSINHFLPPEEAKYILPAIQLSQSTLSR